MTAAKPEISRKRNFSTIWFVPVVAVLLGVWMVIHTYLNEGPEIEISFTTRRRPGHWQNQGQVP